MCCTLLREGEYDGAHYTIRYFKPQGQGELKMDDGTVFTQNDSYPRDSFTRWLFNFGN